VAGIAFAAIVLLVWRIEYSAEQLVARGKSPASRAAHWQFVRRAGIYLLADAIIVSIAYYLALPIRFAGGIPPVYYEAWRAGLWVIVFVHLTVNAAFGIYTRIWRYASAPDALVIAQSAVVSAAVLMGGEILLGPVRTIPLALIAVGSFFAMAGFTALRYRWRLFAGLNRRWQSFNTGVEGRRVNTLIVGAGESGQSFSWQLQNRRRGQQFRVVGFVDDDPSKIGMSLHGVRILGGRDDIPRLVELNAVELIIFAINAISGQEFREMLAICQSTPAQIKIAPDVFEGLEAASAPLVRDVTVEDLLGRSSTEIDLNASRSLIAGRTVMVTGAAGSIGSELCRQIADLGPARLVAVDVNETGLYDLALEIDLHLANTRRQGGSPLTPWVGDVTDRGAMRAAFAAHPPEIIFHAAAYKHVPLMEAFPMAAVRVNTLGAYVVAELAREFGAERFVLVSTDKAVNPANVMGATKRLGELLMLAEGSEGGTCYTAVRFGNVLNSRGSVVPVFQKQIDAGGPVTVTHPEVDRYFMSLPEAVRLIIQAATLTGGGDLFMLDMGESIRIADLAERMIRLRGLRPGVDIAIDYTGLRPGEKLHEELISPLETRADTAHPHIHRIVEGPGAPVRPALAELRDFVEGNGQFDTADRLARLWELIGCGAAVPEADGRSAWQMADDRSA
jgi:FlaA1/EpsC-like NDP-sugar epimerase